jgi:hypothetical protein
MDTMKALEQRLSGPAVPVEIAEKRIDLVVQASALASHRAHV